MLTVWGRRSSSNVQAVMWAIGEMELPYHRIDAGFRYGVVDTPEFLAMNPNGLVPVVRDGDGPALWESGAILRYLAGRYGPESFWPADPVERADVDRWAEWSKISIAMGFAGPVFWKVVRTAPSQQDPIAIRAGIDALEKKLAIAEARLEGQAYLAGTQFTLADILFGHILFRYYDIDIERAELPALRSYYERLAARPAYVKHVMVPYDELRVSD
ncbi:glutathione S-transferase family protein [Thioclava sp. BHET1]|nr:glutathione S-transferase family protein [Thioclava sp. BHET1]